MVDNMSRLVLYKYCTSRSKFKEKNKTVISLKINLMKKGGKVCYICEHTFDKLPQLELEHVIPVEVGGHLFDGDNIRLVCRKCHLEKTRIDKMTINMLKRFRIIWGKYYITSFFPINEVIDFYKYFRRIKLFLDVSKKSYESGENGADYTFVEQGSNRESKTKSRDGDFCQ